MFRTPMHQWLKTQALLVLPERFLLTRPPTSKSGRALDLRTSGGLWAVSVVACWGPLAMLGLAILLTVFGLRGSFIGMPALPPLICLGYALFKRPPSGLETWFKALEVVASRHLGIELSFWMGGGLLYLLQSFIILSEPALLIISSGTMAFYMGLHLLTAMLGQRQLR